MAKKPIEELVRDQAETFDDAVELEVVEEPEVVVERAAEQAKTETPGGIIALEGDSYISIANRFATGKAARELAVKMYELNGATPVRAGKLIRIRGNK
jgi:alcohol dehydrogenase class IV